jgi:hypothetical protein
MGQANRSLAERNAVQSQESFGRANPRREKEDQTPDSEEPEYMHKLSDTELSSDRLKFQLNELFHYPVNKVIAGGMPRVALLPDDLQVLVAASEVAPMDAHALNLEKSVPAQGELEVKSARLGLLRELTNNLASSRALNDVLREATDRTRRLMRSDFPR